MGFIPDQQKNMGSFIPTTGIFEVARLYEIDVDGDEFKELLARLYQTVNNIANVLNLKDTGYYLTEEFVTGSNYFNPASSNQDVLRPVFRTVINMGPLGAGLNPMNHNLAVDAAWSFVKIYGTASGYPNFYPIPWASATGINNIELVVNATQVVINNLSGVTFTTCYVVLEYVKE